MAAAGSGITTRRVGDCDSGEEVLAVAREDDYIELGRTLSEVSYPCGKDELLRRARINGTEEDLLARLNLLPDRLYEGADEALMFADDSERDQSGEPLA